MNLSFENHRIKLPYVYENQFIGDDGRTSITKDRYLPTYSLVFLHNSTYTLLTLAIEETEVLSTNELPGTKVKKTPFNHEFTSYVQRK
jgi:hypothetical protein